MYPTYVYSRRANGAKAKKSKASASFAPKSSSRRSANMGKPDSDDAIFSPEGYTSSASSTSSFAFRRRSSPLVPSGFHRPATGSNRDDRLISLGEAQNPTLSREVAPAFMPLQQQRLLPYPSVLLHPEEVNTFALPATGSSALAYHEIQATLSPNTVNFENFKSPSPRPRSDVSMTLRSDWSNEDSVTTPAVKPFGSRECTTSMISKTDISQGRADREQLGLALYQRLGYSSSPTMLSSNFDSPLQLPKPGTPPSFSLSQGTIHASTSTGYNADYNDCMKNVLARNQNGHILQDHRAYEPSFQPGTGLYSATSWSHDNVSPYQIHQEFDSTHTERLPNMRRHLPDSRASGFLPPTYGQDTEVTCVSSSPLPSLSYLNMTPSNTSQEGKTSEGKALSKIGE